MSITIFYINKYELCLMKFLLYVNATLNFVKQTIKLKNTH